MTSPPTPTPSAPARDPEVRERSLSETLPPYRVVLHNDDVNEMTYVARALRLKGAGRPQGTPLQGD